MKNVFRLVLRNASSMNKPVAALSFLIFLLLCHAAFGTVIKSGTIWSGEVSVDQDVLIPAGVTLTIAPGTTIRVVPAESTRTDPEFLSPQTEITVRGTLVADGRKGLPVTFLSSEKKRGWAGIIVDGGKAVLRSAAIHDADTAVEAIRGFVQLTDSVLTGNKYGLVVYGPDSDVHAEGTQVKDNDYGVMLLSGAKLDSVKNTIVKGNRKKDSYSLSARQYRPAIKEYRPQAGEKSRVYKDDALLGTTIWQGRIEVDGIVRVPQGSRLIITPGTVVEFRKKDSSHDGIGENGLLIQGIIIAKGTPEKPIFFRSAEEHRAMGDWDSINIIDSDKAQNLIEYCQIEDAYRGLHFHFSNVAVANSVLKNNYRGIQFQESIVEIRDTRFLDNKSALQARDSEIGFSGNTIYRNYSGINIFRDTITFSGNSIIGNYRDGLKVREGLPVVEGNLIEGNRFGLMIIDGAYGTYDGNVISHNLESGISLKSSGGIDIGGNLVQGNGINGINIQDSGALIRGNLISDNGERGIGVVTFEGSITGNNILDNGLYDLGIEGAADVPAPLNWWGGGDVRKTIFDKADDPSKGRAVYTPVMERPAVFTWPLKTVPVDALWRGDIGIKGSVIVESGINLAVKSGAKVLFSKGAGLVVRGRIVARGKKNRPVVFTSLKGGGAGQWDEMLLDHAVGSAFSNCVFSNATWALHVHFTNLKVKNCSFLNNYGGMRFTSGPMEVVGSTFKGNEIGIRAFRGNARFAGNVITGNSIGLFVREKGSGLTLRENDFFDNNEYNIRLGDFNTEDVDARDNWWGGPVPSETIYDARREPGIGMVNYEPYAKRPFFPADTPGGKRVGKGAVAK
ncbi:MAG: right-handed parallel beta-helix repeat-containing protein [Nitrospiraceae bacterium]|nr:right-handed parallel beta-helix repeat-containing protein [Nitrospiraceae bacterium]